MRKGAADVGWDDEEGFIVLVSDSQSLRCSEMESDIAMQGGPLQMIPQTSKKRRLSCKLN